MIRRPLLPRRHAHAMQAELDRVRAELARLTRLRDQESHRAEFVARRLQARLTEADEVRAAVASFGHPARGPLPEAAATALAAVTARMHRAEGELAAIRRALHDGWRAVPDDDTDLHVARAVTEVLVLTEVARRGGPLAVDGDLLRDAITDAVPRTITDEAARAFVDQVLDGLVGAGMTVVHGPDGTPRPGRTRETQNGHPSAPDDLPDPGSEATEICNEESSALTPPVHCDRGRGHHGWHYHHATTHRFARAEDMPWERTVSIGWATPGVDRSGS